MAKVEVMNFEEVFSNPGEAQDQYMDENENGGGRYQELNEIAEVDASNEENTSPVNP